MAEIRSISSDQNIIKLKPNLLISLGCYNNIKFFVVYNTFIFDDFGGWKSEIRVPQGSDTQRGLFYWFAYSYLLGVGPWQKESHLVFWPLLHLHELITSETSISNIITLGLGFNM
jgi:hypothetical protein